MVQKQKIIIFDLDGTLIDTSLRWYKLHSDLAQKYKFKPYGRSTYIRLKRRGLTEKQIMQWKLQSQALRNYLKARESLIESKYYLSFDKLKPEIKKLLKTLKKNHQLFLTTSRLNVKNLKTQLLGFGIRKYFSKIIVGESQKERQWKLKLLIGSARSHYVLVGDTPRDYMLAKKMGIECFLVSDGSRAKVILKKLKPQALFDKISLLNEKSFN